MMNSKVSIIIPVYNIENYIGICLESICKQTYKNIEIIVVNDGSEQNEDSIIQEYMRKDGRIRYVKKDQNEGLFAARITGVKEATGDYIQFVDGDDRINRDFVRLLVEKAETTGSDIVFSRTATCTPRGSESIYVIQDAELKKLPLEDDFLKEAYFCQAGYAYIWHTIWNKIYSKKLWEKALPKLVNLKGKHVMTEDIVFSSVLFYFANRADYATNATYFYCKHADASTNSNSISIGKFRKQIGDVCRTFDFLREFFLDKEEWISESIEKFRKYYARMWQRLAEGMGDPERSEAFDLCSKLCPVETIKEIPLDDNYFCHMEVPYNNEFDELKNKIIDSNKAIISFDVFDTLITRPLFRPEDIFVFLDKKYEELCEARTSFHDIRIHGEEGCRINLCNEYKEDVTLDEIYEYISTYYGINAKICEEIKENEIQLELQFCKPRQSGRELYTLAKDLGKRIVVISDMYLSSDCIIKLLNKNGYDEFDYVFVSSEYSKLKKTSSLYTIVLKELGIQKDKIIHVGDNEEGDIKAPLKLGIDYIHLPKSIDAFCGKIKKNGNVHRATIGSEIAGGYTGKKGFEKGIAYGAALALASNKYFDNPYVGFNDFTDFNVDPYFVGYYTLGMNLIGQIQWLNRQIENAGYKRILFTSRDGKLLMDAFQVCKQFLEINIPTEYIYLSRRSMLPWMIKNEMDFLELPIVFQRYTPKLIDELLAFCCKEKSEDWKTYLEKNGIEWEKNFFTIMDYHSYMRLFIDYRYDKEKHEKAKEIVAKYMLQIDDSDAIYDLGYSAAIHRALCDACGKHPTALFMHTDDNKHITNARRGKFAIESIMDIIPDISGLMREFFFSDVSGSCIGYKEEEGSVIPVLEDINICYTDSFPILMMQRGALDMVKDFFGTFADYYRYIEIRTEEFLMPFESFLASPTPLDTKMFIASYFEDKVYGRIERINVRDFWTQVLLGQKGYRKYDVEKYFNDLLKKYGKRRLAFFGTGKMCEAMYEDYPNLPVEVFLDNNPDKSGTTYRGKKVVRPEEYPNLKELYIVVVISFYKEVEEQLRDLGLTKYDDYLNYLELF